LPMHLVVDTAEFINLGDWISNYTYAVFDGDALKLLRLDGTVLAKEII